MPGEEHLRVRRLLTRMAAAEPHRYVVIDADGSVTDVADRVLMGLTPVLPAATAVAEPGGRGEP
jgi:dTMP kinase